MAGKHPAAVELGRLGGRAGKGRRKPSSAIKAAARINGCKGGRPRKVCDVDEAVKRG